MCFSCDGNERYAFMRKRVVYLSILSRSHQQKKSSWQKKIFLPEKGRKPNVDDEKMLCTIKLIGMKGRSEHFGVRYHIISSNLSIEGAFTRPSAPSSSQGKFNRKYVALKHVFILKLHTALKCCMQFSSEYWCQDS